MSSEIALRLPTLGRFCLLTAVLRRLPPWVRSEYSDSTSAGKDLCSRPAAGMSPLGGWSGMHSTVPVGHTCRCDQPQYTSPGMTCADVRTSTALRQRTPTTTGGSYCELTAKAILLRC